jgi:hypothetical protein
MNLLNRLERLERDTPGIRYPDHMVCYIVDIGEDADAKQAEALAKFRAENQTRPGDSFGFICQQIVAAKDGRPC